MDLSRADFSRPVPLVEFYRDNLKDQGVVEAAAIPVERIEGPVLLISGGNDQVWPAESLSDLAMAGIERRRRPYPRVHLKCPKAGHLTSYPYLPITGEGIRLAEMGLTLAFGGEPAAAAVAADSWPRVREFFREALG